MNRIVCIDPGHGGRDSGAEFKGRKESDIVYKIKDYTLIALAKYPDISPISTRTVPYTFVSLQERCSISNLLRTDCFVSIHCNADPDDDNPGDPEAKGEEIWIYKGSVGGRKLAECLAGNVDKIFPDEPFRGIKETDRLYVLRHTRAPAALIEVGFIDKSSSLESFDDENTLRRIGGLIAGGIHDYIIGIP